MFFVESAYVSAEDSGLSPAMRAYISDVYHKQEDPIKSGRVFRH